jgi:hypothetical protein
MADFLDTNGLRLLWEKIKALVLGKTDKVANAVSGNFAGLDSTGNLTDSGYSSADFVSSSDLSNTPKIVIPSVDGTIQNMTNDEIASLKIGDIVINANWLNYYVVKKSGDANGSEILLTYVDNTNIGVISLKKANGVWAYNRYWSIALTNINSIPNKADKILVSNVLPSSGMLSNKVYNLGELQNNTTFQLAAATDNTIMNVWHWTFTTGGTVPTITWPPGVTKWADGSAPNVVAYKYYEIKVHNGCATVISADVPQ